MIRRFSSLNDLHVTAGGDQKRPSREMPPPLPPGQLKQQRESKSNEHCVFSRHTNTMTVVLLQNKSLLLDNLNTFGLKTKNVTWSTKDEILHLIIIVLPLKYVNLKCTCWIIIVFWIYKPFGGTWQSCNNRQNKQTMKNIWWVFLITFNPTSAVTLPSFQTGKILNLAKCF